MRASRVSAYVFVVAASLVGCAGSDGDVAYSGQVRITSPELVKTDSGVMVVADADEPLFHSEGNYWLYRDGYWLRSHDYRRSFVRVDLSYLPPEVRAIERPQSYVQYRRHHGRTLSARAPQPPAETWQPTQPKQTPLIAPPGDVHGNPMPSGRPPGQGRPGPQPIPPE